MVVVELEVGLELMMIEAEVRKAKEVVIDASSQLPAYSRTPYQIKSMQYRNHLHHIQVCLNRLVLNCALECNVHRFFYDYCILF